MLCHVWAVWDCAILPVAVSENRTARTSQHSPTPTPRRGWAHRGWVLNDKLVGQPHRPEPQNVPRDQLHCHILNVALVDKRAVSGVKVLEDEGAIRLVEFDERMVVVNVCGLRWGKWRSEK